MPPSGTPTPANLATVKQRETKGGIIVNDADEATKAKALLAYCPDLSSLAEPDHEEAMYERFREGRTTLADAHYMLAENDRAAKPCADTRTHLLGIIATQEAAEQAYRAERDAARAA